MSEEYSVGYDEGYQSGLNAAMDSIPAQPKVEQEPVAYIDERGVLQYYKPSDFNQCKYGGLQMLYAKDEK